MSRLLAAALIGAVLLAAGCGGEHERGTGQRDDAAPGAPWWAERPSAPLDAKSFRAEVTELCEASTREMQQQAAALAEPEVLFERILRTSRDYQREFEELVPPPTLRKLHERSLAEGRLGIVILERFLEDFRGGEDPLTAFRRMMSRLRPLIRVSKETARRMGVPECARMPADAAQEA
jgi:hypothetical protein